MKGEFNIIFITDSVDEWREYLGSGVRIVKMDSKGLLEKLGEKGILTKDSIESLNNMEPTKWEKRYNLSNPARLVCGIRPFLRDIVMNERDIEGGVIEFKNEYWGWIDADVIFGDTRNLINLIKDFDYSYFRRFSGQLSIFKSSIQFTEVVKGSLNGWIHDRKDTWAWDEHGFVNEMRRHFKVGRYKIACRFGLNVNINKMNIETGEFELSGKDRRGEYVFKKEGESVRVNGKDLLFLSCECLFKDSSLIEYIQKIKTIE
jgi:hypothetical protein